jgi:acetyl-CoA carboxylase alpha subunit
VAERRARDVAAGGASTKTPGPDTAGGASTKAPGPDTPPDVDEEALREAVWARVQMARNVRRPHTLELLALLADDVVELHGDRSHGDDPALVGGFARIGVPRVVVLGHPKGATSACRTRRATARRVGS